MLNYSTDISSVISQRARWAVFLLTFVAVACGEASESVNNGPNSEERFQDVFETPDISEPDTGIDTWTPVISNYEWLPTPSEDDPHYEASDAKADLCTPDDYGVEELPDGPWFDITTSICGYLTVDQGALTQVSKGDTLRIRVWHFQIIAGEGPYHLELSTREPDGDITTLWSEDVNVPIESQLFYLEWESPIDIEAGAPLYWHVSNHGINTWGLIEVLVSPSDL
jgi:hypothetical protein